MQMNTIYYLFERIQKCFNIMYIEKLRNLQQFFGLLELFLRFIGKLCYRSFWRFRYMNHDLYLNLNEQF